MLAHGREKAKSKIKEDPIVLSQRNYKGGKEGIGMVSWLQGIRSRDVI
jgi:hypothetical protein